MRSWANNPRYLRAQQKIMALRPEHRAILNTVTADPAFAGEKMRQSIQSLITATGNKDREKRFGLAKEMASSRNARRKRNLSYDKGRGDKAVGLGVANLGLSAAGTMKSRKDTEELLEEISKLNLNLDPIVGIGNKSRFAPRY